MQPDQSTTTKLDDIKAAVKALSDKERCELNAWLQDWPSDGWDRQMQADAKNGKFDALIRDAEEAFERGEHRSFP